MADHSEQGWCRLCNGIILFDDGHYLTPDGHDQLISGLTALSRAAASAAAATRSSVAVSATRTCCAPAAP